MNNITMDSIGNEKLQKFIGSYFLNKEIRNHPELIDRLPLMNDNEWNIPFDPAIFLDDSIINENTVKSLDELVNSDDDDDGENWSILDQPSPSDDNVADTAFSEYDTQEYLMENTYVVSIDNLGIIVFPFKTKDTNDIEISSILYNETHPTILCDNPMGNSQYYHPLLSELWQSESSNTRSAVIYVLKEFGKRIVSQQNCECDKKCNSCNCQ